MDGTLAAVGYVTVVTLASLGGGVVLLTAWYGLQCAGRVWEQAVRERRAQEAVDAALDKVSDG